MTRRSITALLRRGAFLLALTAGFAWAAAAVAHQDKPKQAPAQEQAATAGMQGGHMESTPDMANMRMPRMDPERGRKLFVSKGCVACHAINGVGGHDATALDAHTMQPMMNPFDFAAKMWRMAPDMIAAQEEGLGGQIFFTGDELADIIAFVHNDEAQHHFSDADLTPEAHRMMHHEHGEPGGGPKTHAEELGHKHMMGQGHSD